MLTGFLYAAPTPTGLGLNNKEADDLVGQADGAARYSTSATPQRLSNSLSLKPQKSQQTMTHEKSVAARWPINHAHTCQCVCVE
jgi:hypothetical protein